MTKKTVWIAGTTRFTKQCMDAFLQDERFEVTHCITPEPRVIGRKQLLTQNPVHEAAEANTLSYTLVNKKIDATIKEKLNSLAAPDILLVVDFGYIVPQWLLELPKVGPLNIHPSLLPRWRGSSPGQYTLLYGETHSAITLMQMSSGLDEGPVITQLPLTVQPTWTAADFYATAFNTISPLLADLCIQYCGQPLATTPQPALSPTPKAERFSKEDGFVSWEVLTAAQTEPSSIEVCERDGTTSAVIRAAAKSAPNLAVLIERACRALSPWPGLWTLFPTSAGVKRLKIHSCSLHENKLRLETVQVEGKTNVHFSEVKDI